MTDAKPVSTRKLAGTTLWVAAWPALMFVLAGDVNWVKGPAFAAAVSLARSLAARLTILYVIPPVVTAVPEPYLDAGLPISAATLICTPCHSGRPQILKCLLFLKVPPLIKGYFLQAKRDDLLNRRNHLEKSDFGVGQL
jgi:hypothetical protein